MSVAIDPLKGAVRGAVIEPGDEAYEEARLVMNRAVDCRPAVIVRAADAHDVVTVVNVARETGMELAVRSGGHSAAGHGTTDGGIVLDLSAMKGLEIDVAGRTVWAEAGLTAGEVTTATGEHGLAVGFGDTGSVGIGGITVGGGIGYLVRKFGLTIDSLLAAEIVTANGETLQVDADSHPDLFWAIRGGGGNFGVVTRFKYALQEVPTTVGGMLILPATADTIAGFMAAAADGARGAVDDRERDAVSADAVRPRGRPRPDHHPRAHVLRRGRGGRAAGDGAIPWRWQRRSPTWSSRSRMRPCTPKRTPTTTRSRSAEPSSWSTSAGTRRSSILERLGRLGCVAARDAAPCPRRRDGPRARERDRFRSPVQQDHGDVCRLRGRSRRLGPAAGVGRRLRGRYQARR